MGKVKKIKIKDCNNNTLFGEIIAKNKEKLRCLKNMSEITNLEQNLIIKKMNSETINAQINNNLMLMSIVGQFNQNLKELEKLTSTNIFFQRKFNNLQRKAFKFT